MSIKAFYRTWVATTQEWGYYVGGRAEEVYSPIKWVKVNVQPFKDGFGFNLSETGITFQEYTLLYSKYGMETDQPEGIPDNAVTVAAGVQWVFFDGKWYYVAGSENWTRAGKAPKHYKYAIKYASDSQPELPAPTPQAQLVEDFEEAVRRLSYDIN